MTPPTYTLQPMVRGDQWRGISSITILVNGDPPASTLASARMHFRLSRDSREIGLGLSSAVAGEITIVSAANWQMSVPPRSLNLHAGLWGWDLETTSAAGVVKTYLEGTLLIQQDITR